jgi:MarR family transcriptional regulator, organic hydroperoxide resistance regulator
MSSRDASPAGQSLPPSAMPLQEERIAHLVRDARRGLMRALQTVLARHSVAAGHWTFLRILWVRDGVNQRELSELAGVMEPTTFAALKAMEQLGYVTRRRRPDNRKNIYVHLTDMGRNLRDVLTPQVVAINEQAVRGVSPADVAATRRALLAMIGNLADYEAEGASTPAAAPAEGALADG